jgi:hypothetical protein
LIHPNEYEIDPKSAASLKAEADYMETHYGIGYVEALKAQMHRQMMGHVLDRAAEREIKR